MENYSSTSYPESGDSSPRSREIEFENPPPWEDQSSNNSNNYKVKFMCSYGGKIHPRSHDNQLSYIGGETKILAVDRSIKFSGLVAKLIALCDADVCFKYQLPGEDLDALISVTNDDDLEHMMHEYDRLYRSSPKPARLRLFLFPVPVLTPAQNFGSTEGKSEREIFVEALNSGPVQLSTLPVTVAPPGNADFLFGLEKGMPPPVVVPKIVDPVANEPDVPVHEPNRLQKQIRDLQRLRIGEEQQAVMYRRKSDDNLAGDYYYQKVTEKVAPTTLPGTVPGTTGYWTEKQISGGLFPGSTITTDQPVYMMPSGANVYHAPIPKPVTGTGPSGQAYYAVQNIYREQPVYNVFPPAQQSATQPTMQPQLPQKITAYSEGTRMVQSITSGGVGVTDTRYAQVAYDNGTSKAVYYPTQGPVMTPPQQPAAPYQAIAAVTTTTYSADMRPSSTFNQEGGKVVPAKISQAFV